MDVNMINRNQEYLKTYTDNLDVSQYDNNKVMQEMIKIKETAKDEETAEKDTKKDKNKYSEKDLDEAVKKLNEALKEQQTHTEYERHEKMGITMVKVVKDQTEEVVLELPPKKILDMVASMCEQAGILDKKV